MVTEADYGQYVLYVDGDELKKFVASKEQCVFGYGYEWENENVIHLHFYRPIYAFGREIKVLFSKDKSQSKEDDILFVDVLPDGTAKVGCYEVTIIPERESLYSRSRGLLEVDILQNKRVLIVGLGSGGSAIAIELAKAGVGQFAIVDFDRVELHNLSRHICTVNDLGRLKTDAVYDALKGKNPYVSIDKFPININRNIDILRDQIQKADIVLCCTDNNQSRFLISKILKEEEKIGIFGRAVTRAEGGDVFIYRPGCACYCCLVGNDWYDQTSEEITDLRSARRSGRIAAYVSEDDATAMVQVGLGADIEPINNMIVKLALVELSRGTQSGITSLEDEFKQNYYLWANRRERHYANWGAFDNSEGLPTIMRWYGVDIEKEEKCALCGNKIELDLGKEYEDVLIKMGGMLINKTSLTLNEIDAINTDGN